VFVEQLDSRRTHESHRRTLVRAKDLARDLRFGIRLFGSTRKRVIHVMLGVKDNKVPSAFPMSASIPAIRTAVAPLVSAENPASSFACIPLFTVPSATRDSVVAWSSVDIRFRFASSTPATSATSQSSAL